MTKEEILAMESDDGLNAAVAEMMGDDLEHQWTGGAPKSGVRYCTRCGTPDWSPAAERHCSVKLYSKDISVAWLVVEKMKEDGYNLRLEYFSEKLDWTPKDNLTQVVFSGYQGYYFDGIKGNIEIPEAICKAALIARLG